MAFVSGAALAVWNVVSVSMRQADVPIDLLGRVNSAYRTAVLGVAPIGAIAGGILADGLGIPGPFVVGGAVLIVVSVISSLTTRGSAWLH